MKQEEKVLYISDLDGTLLNQNARLSEKTAAIISQLIQKGLLFTIATARSQSCVDIIADLGIQLPAVQLNGVLIYDFAKKQWQKAFMKKHLLQTIAGLNQHLQQKMKL